MHASEKYALRIVLRTSILRKTKGEAIILQNNRVFSCPILSRRVDKPINGEYIVITSGQRKRITNAAKSIASPCSESVRRKLTRRQPS